MRIMLLILFFSYIGLTMVFAQDHHLVQLESRSPDAQALVQGYEGTKAILFQANDYKGEKVTLTDLHGQNLIMWFWNLDCTKCLTHLPIMNQLYEKT